MQEINTFTQLEGESLADSWERFHELLRRCPHHRLTRWMQVHTFYNDPSDYTRTIIDASIRGALMKKTTNQAYRILEDMATNSNQWPRDRVVPRNAMGSTNTDVLSNLVNHVAQLTKKLQRQQGAVDAIQTNPWEICESYGGQHSTIECKLGQMTIE